MLLRLVNHGSLHVAIMHCNLGPCLRLFDVSVAFGSRPCVAVHESCLDNSHYGALPERAKLVSTLSFYGHYILDLLERIAGISSAVSECVGNKDGCR